MTNLTPDGRDRSTLTRTREVLAIMRGAVTAAPVPIGRTTYVGETNRDYVVDVAVEFHQLKRADGIRHRIYTLSHTVTAVGWGPVRVGNSVRLDTTTGEIWHTGRTLADHDRCATPARGVDLGAGLWPLLLPTVDAVASWCERSAYDVTPASYHSGRKVWKLARPVDLSRLTSTV
ncbi:hypothetical protein SEA_BIPAUNETO_88 [Gordonia phage BiPauneto]|nr:hypothetical protein SEA_BIPAUNETO_88 [Gordonia phage BiPauneto]